jgi:hypothetical protein
MKNVTMMLLTAAVAVPLTFAADAPKHNSTATAATKPAATDTKPVK